MKQLLIPALIATLPCMAQGAPQAIDEAAFQKDAMKMLPDFVFTLKKPTKFQLPKPVQNMIMGALNSVDPQRAMVLRAEYEAIYQDKDELRKWVDDRLGEWHRAVKLLIRDQDSDMPVPDRMNLIRMEVCFPAWAVYNQMDWGR